MDDIGLPPVRQPVLTKCAPEKKPVDNIPQTKRVTDNSAWDKYDADTELLKLDLEQDRVKEQEQKQTQRVEMERLKSVVSDAEKMTKNERLVLAAQENSRGNEYYKTKNYKEAIDYYSASIQIWPTSNAYNNRAACYLKQCKYSDALKDTNSSLALEPDNIKALYRRRIALQHKNEFKEADMNAVLKQDPKPVLAQNVSKELQEQILDLPKTFRIMIDEGLNKPKKIVEMSKTAMAEHCLTHNSYEVNEWGLPKVMCQCSGSPAFLQNVSKKCHVAHDKPLSVGRGRSMRITEFTGIPKLQKPTTKLGIVEIQKPESSENFFVHKKYGVIDQRPQKIVLPNSNTVGSTLINEKANTRTGQKRNLPVQVNEISSGSGDSGMDEDYEGNHHHG